MTGKKTGIYCIAMNEKTDILGSIADAFKSILQTLGIMAIVACFVICLFAPMFSGMVESSMIHKANGGMCGLTELPIIERKMRYVNVILWIIAICSWALLIGLNLKP